jgi:hypothetical protein
MPLTDLSLWREKKSETTWREFSLSTGYLVRLLFLSAKKGLTKIILK